jgi:hypothetical protein
MIGIPRVAPPCARAGAMPAVPTATAVSKAIARAAGALRRVLIGVPSKDIPMCTECA